MKHPLNLFFDKIFVISIDRNKDRLDVFLKNNYELDVEVFKGIDGQLLYPDLEHVSYFPETFFKINDLDKKSCSRFNKGQLGCAMSNKLIHKLIVDNSYKLVLVLEDDALLMPTYLTNFKEACKELPKNWELFYLGYNPLSNYSENNFLRILTRIKYFIKPVNIDGMTSGSTTHRFFSTSFSKNLNIPGLYTGTHAYALSYQGAIKLIKLDSPLQKGFDVLLMYANYYKLLKSYSLKKQLFIPNKSFESSLIN
jgi:GR25 family glycosyltransferase involved in LPS biosynthesis